VLTLAIKICVFKSADWVCPAYDLDYMEAHNKHISCPIDSVD